MIYIYSSEPTKFECQKLNWLPFKNNTFLFLNSDVTREELPLGHYFVYKLISTQKDFGYRKLLRTDLIAEVSFKKKKKANSIHYFRLKTFYWTTWNSQTFHWSIFISQVFFIFTLTRPSSHSKWEKANDEWVARTTPS